MTDRHVAIILFDGFELLDVFGPVELLFLTPGFTVDYYGPRPGPVSSSQGGQVVAEHAYDELTDPDIVLLPGGIGTRRLVEDEAFLERLRNIGSAASIVTSVCTGSGVLAAAGMLESYRATSNKLSFGWASSFGTDVEWAATARWVHDRDRWTSSGVAAGMDMTAALITDLCGPEAARDAAVSAELEVHVDSTWDPFAAIHGLA